MALRGTIVGVSGRTVIVQPDGTSEKEDQQSFAFSDPEKKMRVLREKGTRTFTHGHDQEEVEVPAYAQAHPSDLRPGTAVRLMGPPNDGLHSVVILEDQPGKAAAPGKKAPATGISEDLKDKTVEEMRDIARDEDINLHGATTHDDIAKEIKKARRANKATRTTPGTPPISR